MSSNDKYTDEEHTNQTLNYSFNEQGCLPRRPNTATESRLLSKILKKDELAPTRDFSNPPPNVSQQPQANASQQHQANTSQQPQANASQQPQANASQQPQANASQQPQVIASQQPLTLPKVLFTLRADAKEFVPRSQVHNPEESRTLSVTASEFVPRATEGFFPDQFYPNLPYSSYNTDQNHVLEGFNTMNLQGPFSLYEMPAVSTGNAILDRFNYTLSILNLSPGNMEEYLRPICELIKKSSDTTEIVNDVVESLFEQSLQESNFRYTGARICQYLITNLKDNPNFSGFNQIFMQRCQKEYIQRVQMKNGSPADQERLRGLCMFLAEIFLNCGIKTENGEIEPWDFLPKILVELVKTLLSSPSDQDVKCSCQLLKLSGSMIEDLIKHSPEDCIKFEEIFPQLQQLQSQPEITENAKFLIGSVLKLKDSDWNRSSSSPPKKSLYTESVNFQAAEPVFYNHQGVPCTRTEAGISDEDEDDSAYVLNDEEEAAYLEWLAEQEEAQADLPKWCTNDTGYESYQLDDGADDMGMGDEMEAAYEEFLQKQNILPNYAPGQTQQVLPNLPPAQGFSNYPQQPPHLQQSNTVSQPQLPPQNQFPQLQQHPPDFPKK